MAFFVASDLIRFLEINGIFNSDGFIGLHTFLIDLQFTCGLNVSELDLRERFINVFELFTGKGRIDT